MTYSWVNGECKIFNWTNGETLNKKGILDELHKQEKQLDDVSCWINDKIDELEDKYEFGQKYGFCKMHNILFGINILKELKKELSE